MSDCGRHSSEERDWLDHVFGRLAEWRDELTLHYLCPECGREAAFAPPADGRGRFDGVQQLDGEPVCCGWQMVETMQVDGPPPPLAALGF